MIGITSALEAVMAELAASGAQAVVLFGSFARGDATPYSDLDLWALGSGAPRYELRAGRLIVTTWVTPDAARAAFRDPAAVCEAIPAWREARILYDPLGCAADLQREAIAWTWAALNPAACDTYVAREVAGYAEEALKLAGALAAGWHLMAAVQRNVLVLRLAGVLALHRRLLYGTENRLWDMVADEMGEPYTLVQAQAMGLSGEPFEDTCRAALRLYALVAQQTQHILDRQQRPIVAHACARAGYVLEASDKT